MAPKTASKRAAAVTAPDGVAVTAPDSSDTLPYTLQPVTFGRKRRKTSWVWDHFDNGADRNVCRHCVSLLGDDATSYPPTTGNSTLAMHLHTKHGITRESKVPSGRLKSRATAPTTAPLAAATSTASAKIPPAARMSFDVEDRETANTQGAERTLDGEVTRLPPLADVNEEEELEHREEMTPSSAADSEDVGGFEAPERSQLTASIVTNSTLQTAPSAPSRAEILQTLLDFAADERRGLAFLSSGSFRTLCSTLNPSVELPHPDEVKTLADEQLREEEQKLLCVTQEIPGSVALTLDRRSAPGYVVVTLHWISSDWEQQRCLLEFMRVPSTASSEWASKVAELTIAALRRFSVIGKVRAITTDEGVEMMAAVARIRHTLNEEFGLDLSDAVHLRCVAQLLEQCVFAALDEIRLPLAKLRALLQLRDRNGADMKAAVPRVDTSNNWGALFAMIDAADEAKDALQAMQSRVVPTNSAARLQVDNEQVSNSDWSTLKCVKDFLEGAVGYAMVSEDNDYTGASLLPLIYDSLQAHCANMLDGHDEAGGDEAPTLHAQSAVTAFLCLLREYKPTFWGDLANLAQILDPRVSNASAEAAAMKDAIRQKLVDDYGLTLKTSAATALHSSSSSAASSSAPATRVSLDASKPERQILSLFAAARQARNEAHERVVEDEVDAFYKLTAEPDLDCVDVLEWWRVVGSQRFPKLSLLARDTLMIAGSSMPIRDFAGRVCDNEPPTNFSHGGSSDTTLETVMKVRAWRQFS